MIIPPWLIRTMSPGPSEAFGETRPAGRMAAPGSRDGYRSAKRQGKPNLIIARQPPANQAFRKSPRRKALAAVYARFIAMLKLPFKFYRS